MLIARILTVMPQKKRTSAKKNSTSRKSTSRVNRRSNRSKKKVYVPLNNILSLCAIIIGICTALLLANTFSPSKSEVPTQNQQNQSSVEQKKQIEHKNNQQKKYAETKKIESTSKNSKTDSKVASAKKSVVQEKKSVSETKNAEQNSNETKKSSTSENKVATKTTVSATKSANIIEENNKNSSAWDIPNFAQAKNNAKLVFIFDDGGHNLEQLEKCVTLPFPITVAVLPRLTHSKDAASRIRKSGNEVILHQPMQSVNLKIDPGAGAITPNMDEDTIRSTVLANIYEIWPITGMNNHEGSLITADAEKIAAVMKICSQEGIYFLDSRTNSESKVRYVSSVLGYPYYERNIFLDNTKVRKDILSEIEKGVNIANKNGVAIMIGHVWSAEILPGILREVYPVLSAKGYTFTTVSNSGALKRG